MNKFVLIGGSLILAMSIGTASARCIGTVSNGECYGTELYGSDSSDSDYQYDLNNGSDRNSYSIDLDAQRRDQMYIGVDRDMDRMQGVNGGGYYD